MPDIVHKRPLIAQPEETEYSFGIDEAGRGPLLGPMVYGSAYWPTEMDKEMASYGFDDSKALIDTVRVDLLEKMKVDPHIGFITYSISAQEISSDMLARTQISLNVISHNAAISMIEMGLASGIKITKVFVDTVGDPSSYQARLDRHFNSSTRRYGDFVKTWNISFKVAQKADSLFKTVSAASIAAKVTRDLAIENWRFEEPELMSLQAQFDALPPKVEEVEIEDEEIVQKAKRAKKAKPTAASKLVIRGHPFDDYNPRNCGSGYPGDEITKAWVQKTFDKVFGWSSFVRFSWQPAKDACERDGVPVVWDTDENAGGSSGKSGLQTKIGSFFSKKGNSAILAPKVRCSYTSRLGLSYVDKL